MPYYQFNVIFDLTEDERKQLVDRINKIHTQKFHVPQIFMNVGFQDIRHAHTILYHNGHIGGGNSMQCWVRPGSRTRTEFEEVCLDVLKAWNDVINKGHPPPDNGVRTLGGCFVQASIDAAYEVGFIVPPGGEDRTWLVEKRPEIEKRAASGDKECQALLKEIETRDDFAMCRK